MKNKLIGLIIVLAVMAGAVVYKVGFGGSAPLVKQQVTLKGYIGSEKEGLLQDADVQKLLKNKYGITLDYQKAGSIEMVQGSTAGLDFLFPSSQTAVELFKSTQGAKMAGSQTVLNSPLVVYSWDDVTAALEKQGVVRTDNGVSYIVDLPKLIALIENGTKWSDIGLPNLYGKMTLQSTDPVKSNSGNLFSGLLASILNGGQVVDANTITPVLPRVKTFFANLGYMQESSAYLFNQYINTGEGSSPLIVGYENQMIEYAAGQPSVWAAAKSKVRVLYPQPTEWSAHTIIALDAKAKIMLTAFQDPELQAIAWKKHGFRTGVPGIQNNVADVPVQGVPAQITQIIQTPTPGVMDTIIQALGQK